MLEHHASLPPGPAFEKNVIALTRAASLFMGSPPVGLLPSAASTSAVATEVVSSV
jgi:hypothetical protein